MEVKGRSLKSFKDANEIANYPLKSLDEDEKMFLDHVINKRQIEIEVKKVF